MVDLRAERNEPTRAKGFRHPRYKAAMEQTIYFNDELHEAIRREARSRGWTFSHMVRHLCEASIEGIP